MEQKSTNLTRKKVVGFVGVCICILAIVFAALAGKIYFGSLILHTFGFVTYPFFIIMALVSLASFLGLSYSRNKKTTTYLIVSLCMILCLVHSIMTFSSLQSVVDGVSLTEYLSLSYQKMTMLGALGSVVCGSLTILLGEMGTIVIFGILSTLFVGLLIDYNFFGKYEKSVKKLKGHKLKEKVQKSDEKRTENNNPVYSFNGKYTSGDMIDEISIGQNEIEETNAMPSSKYFEEDEMFSTETSDFESSDNLEETNEKPNDPYLLVFGDDEQNQKRRDFMNATFGVSKPTEADYSFESSNFDNFEENKPEDDISKILSSSEDDLEEENSNGSFDFGFEKSNDAYSQSGYETNSYNQSASGFGGFNNSFQSNNFSSFERDKNSGFGFVQEKPKAEPKKSMPKANVQTGMNGLRYNPPPLSLLATPKADKGDYTAEQNRKTMQLESVLESFKIPAKVQKIVRGPKITRYELSVPLGVSVKKIPQYENDIAAALSAKTITIRAPIPGSQYVGIELENDTFTTVYQRELFESDAFQNSKDVLPIAIGKDISGEIIVKGLADMTHLLIAGSTGSGKSVFIHNIVLSLIYKNSPEDLRLIMIDPKRVEFNRYNGLPHLITPEVVMGSQKALNALKWCVAEMDRRYDLMSKAGFNNIKPYNKSELVKAGQFEKFPYIVIIVDELAEIMQANKKEAESCIQRITQLARACGMHMVVATQRPSVDIITGVIKNNIPSRIAFSLQSGIDSKTIINTVGAEKLLGRGDMIFAPTGTSSMPRLQASYASDEEIQAVIDYDKKYNKACYDDNIEKALDAEPMMDDMGGGSGFSFEEPPTRDNVDSYFKAAVKYVIMSGSASISALQRRLSIGFARAGRIVDQMEKKGFVGPANGGKRRVLIGPEQYEQEFGESINNLDE